MELNREELLRFIEDYKRLAVPQAVIGINVFATEKVVHLTEDAFLDLVGDDYIIRERECDQYPWHMEARVNGMKVFTISRTNRKFAKAQPDIVMEVAE